MIDREHSAPHWRIHDDETLYCVADLIDLDSSVSIAIHEDLTPARAHELGRALILWAGEKRAQYRQAVRDAHGLGPEAIVLDGGTHLTPDRSTP